MDADKSRPTDMSRCPHDDPDVQMWPSVEAARLIRGQRPERTTVHEFAGVGHVPGGPTTTPGLVLGGSEHANAAAGDACRAELESLLEQWHLPID